MAWFLGQSLFIVIASILLGVLIGWLLWGRSWGRAASAPAAVAEPEPVAVAEPAVAVGEPEPVAVAEPAVAQPEPAGVAVAEPVAVPAEQVAETEPAVDTDPAVGAVVDTEPVVGAAVVPAEGGEERPDDFERVEGIGPKMAAALRQAGIRTYLQLADAPETLLRKAIENVGLSFAPSLPTWSRQARLLADGDEKGFDDLVRRLVAGRDVGRS